MFDFVISFDALYIHMCIIYIYTSFFANCRTQWQLEQDGCIHQLLLQTLLLHHRTDWWTYHHLCFGSTALGSWCLGRCSQSCVGQKQAGLAWNGWWRNLVFRLALSSNRAGQSPTFRAQSTWCVSESLHFFYLSFSLSYTLIFHIYSTYPYTMV